MFTGIVKGLCPIEKLSRQGENLKFTVSLTPELAHSLEEGASVAIDGVCLTAVEVKNNTVTFDAIPETIQKTTLKYLSEGKKVNVERSVRIGDEIGGHNVSGHVWGTATISEIQAGENHRVIQFSCPSDWIKYLFPKGFIAIDGISLTLVDVLPEGRFTVHLIPETLRRTTLGFKKKNDLVNLEFDTQTQTIVDSVERYLQSR